MASVQSAILATLTPPAFLHKNCLFKNGYTRNCIQYCVPDSGYHTFQSTKEAVSSTRLPLRGYIDLDGGNGVKRKLFLNDNGSNEKIEECYDNQNNEYMLPNKLDPVLGLTPDQVRDRLLKRFSSLSQVKSIWIPPHDSDRRPTNIGLLRKNYRSTDLLWRVPNVDLIDDRIDCDSTSFYPRIFPSQFDLLTDLQKIDCYPILSQILSYLPDRDLQQVSCVSRSWRFIVKTDVKAHFRCQSYLRKKKNIACGDYKENKHTIKSAIRDNAVLFLDITNSIQHFSEQPLEPQQSNNNSFTKERKIGNTDVLLKCPKCLSVSRAQKDGKYCCTRSVCSHTFCKKCFGPWPYLSAHSCITVMEREVPILIVGSKKSKKNLRRL